MQFVQFANAWGPTDGAWLTQLELVGDDVQDIELQRMTTFGQVEVVRTVHDTDYGWPIARMYPTPDGGVLWALGEELIAVAPDSSVRWTSTWTPGLAVDAAGNYLRVDSVPDEDTPQLFRLNVERRAVADNALLWSRSYHRYDFVDAPVLGAFDNPTSTWLLDAPSGAITMDDGYRLLISTAYPSKVCPGQPMVLAVDFDGAVQWGHMVDVCGHMVGLGLLGARSASDGYIVQGRTQNADNPSTGDPLGSWLRIFE